MIFKRKIFKKPREAPLKNFDLVFFKKKSFEIPLPGTAGAPPCCCGAPPCCGGAPPCCGGAPIFIKQ